MHSPITVHLPQSNSTTEQSLLELLPMVRRLARRIHGHLPRNVEYDDIFSAGVIGLIDASAKFSSAKNVTFASYAQFRVRGAILDSLRKLDWAPRHLRQQGRAAREAIQMLTSRLGCSPSDDEVAAELKTSLGAYQKLLGDLHGLEIGTLHRLRADGSDDEEVVCIPAPPEDDPLSCFIRGEATDRLTRAIKDLPEWERKVTTLRYYEEKSLDDIGLALGLDTVRVTHIRASAVRHLRAALSDVSLVASRTMAGNNSLSAQAA
jgi:RNA polymerase sigma factor for flagellar operon FliA